MQALSGFHIEQREGFWLGRFSAMASPCEVFIDTESADEASDVTAIAYDEATRIEKKYSRYRGENIVYQINHANGKPVRVDDETARLLDYAKQLFELSDGKFDITSGVLRRVWKFDGSDRVPSKKDVREILASVGWTKVTWHNPLISLPAGMEVDLGGIGKEYAVDRTALLITQRFSGSVLINYGGDLFCNGPKRDGKGWTVGLDDPAHTGKRSLGTFELTRGGVATSGDARRFLLKKGIRYGHILDPHTGWPVRGAPHGVTVIAPTCTEAGMLATFAMLHGKKAKQFLQEQDVQFWCY